MIFLQGKKINLQEIARLRTDIVDGAEEGVGGAKNDGAGLVLGIHGSPYSVPL